MTNEELKKLTVLQQDIAQLRKTLDVMKNYKFEIRFSSYDQYMRFPFDKIDGCYDHVKDLLEEYLSDKLVELESKFNLLTVCNQAVGGPTYYPANLE